MGKLFGKEKKKVFLTPIKTSYKLQLYSLSFIIITCEEFKNKEVSGDECVTFYGLFLLECYWNSRLEFFFSF